MDSLFIIDFAIDINKNIKKFIYVMYVPFICYMNLPKNLYSKTKVLRN